MLPTQAANHYLEVDGDDWTRRLLSAKVQFRADAGSSGMEFSVSGSAEEYQDAPIELHLGYGDDLQPYFRGTIQTPNDDDRLMTASANAFGPFRNMTTQVLGTNETFVGKTLEWVILECSRRAEYRAGEIIIVNGTKYKVEVQDGEQFPFDNKIGDVLNSLMEKAEFVGVDQPGGRRYFRPKPRPGSTVPYVTQLGVDDYTEFSITPKEDSNFVKVVVYRNGDTGKPDIYAEREVNAPVVYKPKRNRWYVVPDFNGNQLDAQEEAFRLATDIRRGMNSFSIKTFFDPALRIYDGLKCARNKGDEVRMYSCFIDDGISVDYSPGSPAYMDIAGSAYEITRERAYIEEPELRIVTNPGSLLSRQ